MKKSLNQYRVVRYESVVATKLTTLDEAVQFCELVLFAYGFHLDELKNSLSQEEYTYYWFRPNEHHVKIVAYPLAEVIDLDRQDPEVTELFRRIKAFNGKGLKFNAVQLFNPRYKPGAYQPADVRFAESVNYAKGYSTVAHLGKRKRQMFNGSEQMDKLNSLPDQGSLSQAHSLEDIIRKQLVDFKPNEVYKRLKGCCDVGSNELNRLIYKLSH